MNKMKNEDQVIQFARVSKVYHTYSTPQHRLLELLSGGRKRYAHETRALDDVSFSLRKGDRLGIIGENGSGKSTLLKVLAGVLTPTSGSVLVNGRISALLELGAGFNPNLSGSENIRQFCMLHGMHGDEIDEAVPEIIQFSELKDAIYHPVKTYSSGMSVRLGFACAVYVKPEILIVDEALSVGDAYFQNKCSHKIKSMLDNGTTFIYVTHVADSIRALCDRGLWMDSGRIRMAGTASEVGSAYQAEVYNRMVRAGLESNAVPDLISEPKYEGGDLSADSLIFAVDHARHAAFNERVASLRTGSGEIQIQDIVVMDLNGVDTDTVEFGSKIRIQVWFKVMSQCEKECSIGLGITDSTGKEIIHFNSICSRLLINNDLLGQLSYFEFEFENPLCPGEFGLIAGICVMKPSLINAGQYVFDDVVDYCVGGARFKVSYPNEDPSLDLWGMVHLPYCVSTPGSV